ncbi:ABC transporter substrate-binding protein [Shimia ponticola]|uniref:ABC transporter substrate-binding protein n=1 Tax=Shimia ponticola TaxID=2582893 RepID=UPI0011BDEAEE|nr:ABC transporter substrate-binding protein [Shimia ponticola]
MLASSVYQYFHHSTLRAARTSILLVAAAIGGATGVQAADTLDTVEQRGSLVIGSDIPYGVMQFFDDQGNPAGIDIDIARRIATDMGVELSVETMPFDELFQALKDGKVDALLSAVTITPERQETMAFSVPYLDAGMSIAVASENTTISSTADLSDKRVGVLSGTIGEELMQKSDFINSDLLVAYKNNDERLADLLAGEIDAAVVHFLSGAVPGIRTLEPPLTQSFYGVVTRLEDEAFLDAINTTLRDMQKDGEIREIVQQYVE